MNWVRAQVGAFLLPVLFAVCCFFWVPAVLVDHKLADFAISDADVRSSGLFSLEWLRAVYGAHSPFIANWLVALTLIGYLVIPVVSFAQKRFRTGTYLSILLAAVVFALYGNLIVYSQTEHMDKYSISLLAVAVTIAWAFVPVGAYAAFKAVLERLRESRAGSPASKS